ncbi:hypothetical protein H9L14_14115 [Sphingomonas sediminicola]|uniref:Peptidase metallopeptidase domain-containing protein n=1 Tax=Sphingomonas sediminicola TaxID=386874 RepID=A0ABX6T6Z6_9SPHN|nr:hypothetical protein [Sphingomonas sediminicola]QNP45641.1 hypothetical protein H9L14_14115 [Sphingomonas sediminicola]
MGANRVSQVALKHGLPAAVVGALLFAAAGNGSAQNPPQKASKADLTAADQNPIDTAALNKMLAGLPQVTFDDEGTERRYYVWEGDMLLGRDEVQAMLFAHRSLQAPARQGELLLQVRPDGRPGVWARPKRTLTYSIDCRTFESADNCRIAEQAFTKAARDWENVCPTCGVHFRKAPATAGYRPKDGSGPTFVVRYDPEGYDYLAIAFFANDPAFKRYLGVGPDFFTTDISRDGILRHELGHVLGYRHEHNRAPAGCYFEDNQWRALTPYDPKSVMHYLCGAGGTMQMVFTASDRAGHRTAYGA